MPRIGKSTAHPGQDGSKKAKGIDGVATQGRTSYTDMKKSKNKGPRIGKSG